MVDLVSFGRTKVDSLKVGELLSILQYIGELRSILANYYAQNIGELSFTTYQLQLNSC